MKRFSIITGLLLLPVLGIAQQATNASLAAAEFRLVNQTYLQTPKLSMNVRYTLFPGYTSTAAFETENGVYMKQGNNTYSYLLGIVSLSNAAVSLTLDSNEQSIVITDSPGKNARKPDLVNIDSLLKICSSVDIKDVGGNLKLYKLKFDKLAFFEYNAIDVYINSESHFLERLILYYRSEMDLDETDGSATKDKPRLEIYYSNISTSPVFAADQFSEKKFIQSSGKKFSCTKAYASYRLINNKLK